MESTNCPAVHQKRLVKVDSTVFSTRDLCLETRKAKGMSSPESAPGQTAAGICEGKEQNVKFLVSSHALKQARSRRAESLHDGSIGFGPPLTTYVVEIPEDSSFRAMETLLRMVHHPIKQSPWCRNTIDQKGLYEVTILADVFGFIDFLRPRAQVWLHHIGPGKGTLALERTLWVAWVLGDLAVVKDIAKVLALNSAPCDFDRTTIPIRKPPGVLGTSCATCLGQRALLTIQDAINALRLQAIGQMLSPFWAALDTLKYIRPGGVGRSICCNRNLFFPSQGRCDACEAFMLGQLQRELVREHLLPPQSLEDIEISVAALARILKTVDSKIEALDSNHSRCKPVHAAGSLIDQVLADAEVELTDTYSDMTEPSGR